MRNEDRPGWGFYVFRQHVIDMIESIDRRGTAINRNRNDYRLQQACLSARGSLSELASLLALRENTAVEDARRQGD